MMTIAAPTLPPRRRRLVISLRVMMLVVLVAGTWLGWRAICARDQRIAVREILKTGGSVNYDWEVPLTNKPPPSAPKPWAPKLLRDLFGDEPFQDVVSVNVGGRGPLPRELLRAIGRLPNVERLNLAMTRVDADGMAELSGMTSLKVLVLGNMRITDEALGKLSGLTNLEELYMHWSMVETGTKYLSGMPRLRVITLSHSKLTDEGLESLVNLPALKELTIHRNPLSDAAVRSFIARRPDVTVQYAFPERPRVPQPETSPR